MPHLKLIWYFWHEGRDLFHEPVHAALTPCLQQGGDGEGSDAAVGVGDEVFQVQVAGSDCRWMLHGHLQRKPFQSCKGLAATQNHSGWEKDLKDQRIQPPNHTTLTLQHGLTQVLLYYCCSFGIRMSFPPHILFIPFTELNIQGSASYIVEELTSYPATALWSRNEQIQLECRKDFCHTRISGMEKTILQQGVFLNTVITWIVALF